VSTEASEASASPCLVLLLVVVLAAAARREEQEEEEEQQALLLVQVVQSQRACWLCCSQFQPPPTVEPHATQEGASGASSLKMYSTMHSWHSHQPSQPTNQRPSLPTNHREQRSHWWSSLPRNDHEEEASSRSLDTTSSTDARSSGHQARQASSNSRSFLQGGLMADHIHM